MSQQAQALEHASVRQYCKAVKVPVVGANFVRLAEQAVKENRGHIGYLEALLAMESEERDRHAIAHRLHDAKLPRMKTLEEFDFARAPQIPAAKIRELAEGGYITRAEPVVLIGECGTGKTHLASGLCVAACRQKRRVRFTTAANLVNELVEARQNNAVKRVLARWLRYDVIVLDEVGYVPLADIGAESAVVQGAAGPRHRPRAHHRNRHGVVSLPAHGGRKAKEKSFVSGPGRASYRAIPWPRRPLRPKRGPENRTAGLRSLRGHGKKTPGRRAKSRP